MNINKIFEDLELSELEKHIIGFKTLKKEDKFIARLKHYTDLLDFRINQEKINLDLLNIEDEKTYIIKSNPILRNLALYPKIKKELCQSFPELKNRENKYKL